MLNRKTFLVICSSPEQVEIPTLALKEWLFSLSYKIKCLCLNNSLIMVNMAHFSLICHTPVKMLLWMDKSNAINCFFPPTIWARTIWKNRLFSVKNKHNKQLHFLGLTIRISQQASLLNTFPTPTPFPLIDLLQWMLQHKMAAAAVHSYSRKNPFYHEHGCLWLCLVTPFS